MIMRGSVFNYIALIQRSVDIQDYNSLIQLLY